MTKPPDAVNLRVFFISIVLSVYQPRPRGLASLRRSAEKMEIPPTRMFAEIGSAMWMIQSTEHALVHHIAIVLKQPEDEEAFEMLVTKEGKRTLGGLIAELRKHTSLPDSFNSRVDDFLKERNWLAHHIYRESHSDLRSPTKAPILLQRIESLGDEAIQLARVFADATRAWQIANGADPDELDQLERDALKKWRNQP